MRVSEASKRLPAAAVRRMISLVPKVTEGLPLSRKRVLWRNLVTRFPRESTLAIEYARAMLRSESWDDLAAFEKAARKHKSPVIDLTYVDAALARADVSGAETRLSAFERRRGQSTSTLWRRYDRCFLQHDFDGAIEVARQLKAQSPADRRWAGELIRKAEFYGAVSHKWSSPNGERDYDLFVVNLDSDTVRMERSARQLNSIPFTRVPGVKGAYLPDWLLESATRGVGSEAKGTVGCFLSHIAVWERVARTNRAALVLEDDAWVLAGLPRRLSDIRLPADFEYCFAAESFLPHGFDYRRKTFTLMHPAEIVPGKPADWMVPSTVAYFISPAGARKLLARVARDGAAGDVDWRMVAYSMNARQRRAIIRRDTAGSRLLGAHHKLVASQWRSLNASVLVPSLVRNFEAGSVRLHDNGVIHS